MDDVHVVLVRGHLMSQIPGSDKCRISPANCWLGTRFVTGKLHCSSRPTFRTSAKEHVNPRLCSRKQDGGVWPQCEAAWR